jgi:hypothetical protein
MITVKKFNGQDYQRGSFEGYDNYGDEWIFSTSDPDYMVELIKHNAALDEDSEILNFGSLTIEVRMRLHTDNYCHDDKPQSSLSDDMIKPDKTLPGRKH